MKDGTHGRHCCEQHGCKYRDDNCPVVMKRMQQEFACSECVATATLDKEIAQLQQERSWSQQLEDRGLTLFDSL